MWNVKINKSVEKNQAPRYREQARGCQRQMWGKGEMGELIFCLTTSKNFKCSTSNSISK